MRQGECAVQNCKGQGAQERRDETRVWRGPFCPQHAEAIDETPERFFVFLGVVMEIAA